MIVAHLFRVAMRGIRSVVVLARSFQRAGMADGTCRALDELPDSLLKDMGIVRSEICFVAGALVSADEKLIPNDRASRNATELRAKASRMPHLAAARCGALYRLPDGL